MTHDPFNPVSPVHGTMPVGWRCFVGTTGVTMKDSLGTAYYSRYGQSKQVAFELAVGGRRDQLSYIEEVLRGDVYHVGLTVLVLDPIGKKVGEDSLWGIELSANDSADYLKEVAEEMYFELVGG